MSEFLQRLKGLTRPAAAAELHPLRGGPDISPIGSKFGGRPFAVAAEAWPMCGTCGQGLTFVFQCNLAALPEECRQDLGGPAADGLFAFYYCHSCGSWGDVPGDAPGAWIVRRYEKPVETEAATIEDLSPPDTRTRPCACTFASELSIPDWEEYSDMEPVAAVGATPADRMDAARAYHRACEELVGVSWISKTRVGGYPFYIQGSVWARCRECGSRMRLLAQIQSEEDAGLMWGDCGSVYLFECPAHPREMQMELQCY